MLTNKSTQFKPTLVTIGGTFIVLIAYFLGNAWAAFLPRGDKFEARWRSRGGVGKPPRYITIMSFFNHGPWNLKEHAICAITATSASQAATTCTVFAAQDLFYDIELSATTVVLSVLSIGLYGYGIAGIMRPIAVWHVDAVYWSTLPTVKTLQGLHWQNVKDSKPLRFFWYAFGGMFFYEFFPAYIFPFLNSVSIPCLAAMKATGKTASNLTNVFGGSLTNEGLGLFSLSFDWQYVRLFPTTLCNSKADGTNRFFRLPPLIPHFLSLSRPILPLVTLSVSPRCWESTIRTHGGQRIYPLCRPDFSLMRVKDIRSPKSSRGGYLTTHPLPRMASQD